MIGGAVWELLGSGPVIKGRQSHIPDKGVVPGYPKETTPRVGLLGSRIPQSHPTVNGV